MQVTFVMGDFFFFNFFFNVVKASPLSPGLLVVTAVAAGGRAAWGVPLPSPPPAGEQQHMPRSGVG